MIPWKDTLGMTKYYGHKFLCIVKSNLLSRDQIIAITRGWIFYRNLKYVIVLNKQNLNWCAGYGKPDIHFVGVYEQIQIGIKASKQKLN